MKNAISWFEIPVTDMARAVRFYETMLGNRLKPVENFGGKPMAIFAADEPAVSGCLALNPKRKPTTDGSIVYLDVGKTLAECVARVEKAGGRVILPVTNIGDPGSIAHVLDTEGNEIGLHAPPA